MEKRRVRKTEAEISKGRMRERNRMQWRGRKSAWMEGRMMKDREVSATLPAGD